MDIKERNMTRRKIPIFQIILKNGGQYEQIAKIPELRQAIIEETVFAVKDGIKKKKKSIPLFEIANSSHYINLEKGQWKDILENAISFYIENENYDKCIECRDLIKQL